MAGQLSFSEVVLVVYQLEVDSTAHVQLCWRRWLDERGHADTEDVVDGRIFEKVDYDVALAGADRAEVDGLVQGVQLRFNDPWVGELESNLDSLDIVGEEMTVLVLELDREVHGGANGETEGLVEVLSGQRVDVRDEDVEHGDLVSIGVALLHDDGHFSIFVVGPHASLKEFDDRLSRLSLLVPIRRVHEDALNAVAHPQLRLAVRNDFDLSISWDHVQVSLPILVSHELRDLHRQLVLHFDDSTGLKPILLSFVLFRILYGHPDSQCGLSVLLRLRVNA